MACDQTSVLKNHKRWSHQRKIHPRNEISETRKASAGARVAATAQEIRETRTQAFFRIWCHRIWLNPGQPLTRVSCNRLILRQLWNHEEFLRLHLQLNKKTRTIRISFLPSFINSFPGRGKRSSYPSMSANLESTYVWPPGKEATWLNPGTFWRVACNRLISRMWNFEEFLRLYPQLNQKTRIIGDRSFLPSLPPLSIEIYLSKPRTDRPMSDPRRTSKKEAIAPKSLEDPI